MLHPGGPVPRHHQRPGGRLLQTPVEGTTPGQERRPQEAEVGIHAHDLRPGRPPGQRSLTRELPPRRQPHRQQHAPVQGADGWGQQPQHPLLGYLGSHGDPARLPAGFPLPLLWHIAEHEGIPCRQHRLAGHFRQQDQLPHRDPHVRGGGLEGVYHALLGRPAYTKFMAVPNYTYLKLKIPGPNGVITVSGSFEQAYVSSRKYNNLASTTANSLELG